MGGANFQHLPDHMALWHQREERSMEHLLDLRTGEPQNHQRPLNWKPVWANVRGALHT